MENNINETAYQAFLCMLDTAEEKGREVVQGNDQILIYANGKEGNGIVGEVSINFIFSREKIKKGWFKTEVIQNSFFKSSGMVVNTKDKERFYFRFDNNEDVYNEIMARIRKLEEKEELRKQQSLKDLLC